jgi:Flp pilus assembly protein TadG
MHRFVARARAGHRDERGFFMVWFAMMFVTLLGFAGLALEFNRWESLGVRVQKAADAAALAGAVFLPDYLATAQTTAKATSSKNGFTHGSNGVTVTAVEGNLPNRLKVTIAVPTKNPWGAIVGYGDSTIVRSAVAEYQLPQNLGSPENKFGNNPEETDLVNNPSPQMWGNVFGPGSQKGKGDAHQATICAAGYDNCPNGGSNADYEPTGYFYGIEIPEGVAGTVNIRVFDPAYVHVSDNCTEGNAVNSLNNAATLTAAQIPGYSGSVTPATRYASGSASAYCSGDMYYSEGGNTANPWTTWTLRGPDSTNWDPTNNPILCENEFPGTYPETSTDLPNGTVNSNRLKTLLQSATTYPGTNPARTFASYFRQWVVLCSLASPDAGTYFLQVQTATKIDGSAAPAAGGANRYAIQVGVGTDYSTVNGLKIYGSGRMAIYANATGADTRFYLTRIPPGEAGKTLVLNFFDVGDASLAGDIQVLPPPDSNVTGGVFTSCKYTAVPGNSTGPPWGTFTATGSNCTVTGVSTGSGYNAQWVAFEVPIPNNYTCSSASATGCWVRLRFKYSAGASVQDTTTWSAYVLGEPVRIIE